MNAVEKGRIIYLTGAPASGKTTVAQSLVAALRAREVVTLPLDSDELRKTLTPNPRYTSDERDWFYSALGEIALLAFRSGVTVVVSATASRRAYRDLVRLEVERERRARPSFFEVHVFCPPDVRRARDPKRLYRAQAAGQVQNLPGADATYEHPLHPEVEVDSSTISPDMAAKMILARLGN